MIRNEIVDNPKHPLRYLYQTEPGYPKRIFWKKVTEGYISDIQMSDAIFDKYDLKIRKLI